MVGGDPFFPMPLKGTRIQGTTPSVTSCGKNGSLTSMLALNFIARRPLPVRVLDSAVIQSVNVRRFSKEHIVKRSELKFIDNPSHSQGDGLEVVTRWAVEL